MRAGTLALLLLSTSVGTLSAQEPTAQQRQQAAQAYDRAAALFVQGHFAQAGQWFMTAYRLAPAKAALLQAVRAYRRAGQLERAGTLAILLSQEYPNDAPSVELAAEVMEEAGRRALLVTVDCEGCEVEVDGRMLATRAAYVTPDENHRVVGHFGAAHVEEVVHGAAREQRQVRFERPAGAEVVEEELTEGERRRREERRREEAGPAYKVMSPGVFYVSLAATVALAGVTVWSGVDTLSGVGAYEANPTREAYEAGQDKERRTNILLGVTAGVAAWTIVTAVLTDFSGRDDEEDDDRVEAAIAPSRGGAQFMLRGTF